MSIPLAERLRPKKLDDYIGQNHLLGPKGVLRKMIDSNVFPSMIFWGPPGVGKTTLAQLIAQNTKRQFHNLSAISAGIKDLRDVIERATGLFSPIVFIDEIHRFNKTQQDALLGAVEKGKITLIGATTENPSFEVNSALLSRCQVYVLEQFGVTELQQMLDRAINQDEELKKYQFEFQSTDALFRIAGGDGRKLLNLFEMLVSSQTGNNPIVVNDDAVTEVAQRNIANYDKSGEQHYDIISAFIKSMRGSDPNASLYWMARMIVGGEDPVFIARRMLILASEDIGNANPTATIMAMNCFNAVKAVGYPECRIILSQTAIYLATSAKSNASYLAIEEAIELANQTINLPVPLALRNAPTKLMKQIGYGKGYKYAHDYSGNFVKQQFMPDEIKLKTLYDPGNNPRENEIRKQLKSWWGDDYGY